MLVELKKQEIVKICQVLDKNKEDDVIVDYLHDRFKKLSKICTCEETND
tara:strand:+ start:787 stop:933 length:147 start_codon:yes stop_codon:yes gene_type:complete